MDTAELFFEAQRRRRRLIQSRAVFGRIEDDRRRRRLLAENARRLNIAWRLLHAMRPRAGLVPTETTA